MPAMVTWTLACQTAFDQLKEALSPVAFLEKNTTLFMDKSLQPPHLAELSFRE